MKNLSKLFSTKFFVIWVLLLSCFTINIGKRASYEEITSLFIFVIPAYFALNEAGKFIRTKTGSIARRDKMISRKFIITLFVIIMSTVCVFINRAEFAGMSYLMKVLIPAFFASNEVEKFIKKKEVE